MALIREKGQEGRGHLAGFVVNGGTVKPHENASFGAAPVTVNGATIEPYAGLNLANSFTVNGAESHASTPTPAARASPPLQTEPTTG